MKKLICIIGLFVAVNGWAQEKQDIEQIDCDVAGTGTKGTVAILILQKPGA